MEEEGRRNLKNSGGAGSRVEVGSGMRWLYINPCYIDRLLIYLVPSYALNKSITNGNHTIYLVHKLALNKSNPINIAWVN